MASIVVSSSSFVKPAPFDGATLFVQGSGNALREFLFTDAEAAYTSVAVSSLAPHLIRKPTQQTIIKGSLDRSESYSFLVNKFSIKTTKDLCPS